MSEYVTKTIKVFDDDISQFNDRTANLERNNKKMNLQTTAKNSRCRRDVTLYLSEWTQRHATRTTLQEMTDVKHRIIE